VSYLEVTTIHEALWIYWHGVDDMYAWQEANGLPRDKVLINSGSITVELVDKSMMLYCEVIPLKEDGKPYTEDGMPIVRPIAVPYKEPIPEGVGNLIDWDYGLPEKPKRAVLDCEDDLCLS
jgi:hypothetical protein